MKNSSPAGSTPFWKGFGPALLILTAVLGFLFHESFKADSVLFANDGPLGVLLSRTFKLPEMFSGFWMDLHWIGANGASAPISVTYGILWLLGPVGFAKFFAPITLLLLGASAWIYFRTIGLASGLCTVGALAAALNMNYFSNTCWGLGTRSLTLAAVFLALAALSMRRSGNRWLNAALAGLAVGLGIIEGADNGAIFSLFVAAFVLAQAFIDEQTFAKKLTSAFRVVLVAGFAGFMAMEVLITLLGIAKANSGDAPVAEAEQKTPEEQWAFATAWSLPKIETLRVIIPGLYGYRMDTSEGGEYWGRVGEWPLAQGNGGRSSGAGEYAGVLVVLVAFWSMFQSFRRAGSAGQIFSERERKYIWFWSAMALVALVLAWGRHAPFYQFVYALPYFKTIRNPMKFMHPGHMILMILFAYGLLGLSRRYLAAALTKPAGVSAQLKAWWAKATTFEKRWTIGCLGAVAASVLGYLAYSNAHDSLTKHLTEIGFAKPGTAAMIARFSAGEVGKFVVVMLASVAALVLVQAGFFSGPRSRWAVLLLGLILTVDLARSDTPWIQYYNYKQRYESNAILDILRDKPHEARVVSPSFLTERLGAMFPDRLTGYFPGVYQGEWVQHHFQAYNIQTIDVSQDPRPPADKAAYLKALARDVTHLGRYWQLTNTRYVLGAAGFLDALNMQLDKGSNRFRVRATFDIGPKPGVSSVSKIDDLGAVLATNGPLALFEYAGALPRARLYYQWQSITNGAAALAKLADPAFDPLAEVIVASEIPAPPATSSNAAPATVSFASYAPREIHLACTSAEPAVLLLNDRFDPDWHVTVDGKSEKLLRCNYLMRGVQVPAGAHEVVFRFDPSLKGTKITGLATVFGLVLCGLLFVVHQPVPEPAVEKPGSSPVNIPKKPAK